MEARFAFAPLLLLVLTGLVLFGGAVFAAVRRPGGAGALLLGLLGCGLAFLALLGVAVVGSHTETRRVSYTAAYARPATASPPPHAVAPLVLPPGHGVTRIPGSEELPPGSLVAPPVEASRPASSEPIAVDAKPDWIEAGTIQEGDRTYVVVSSRQFADTGAAWHDAMNRATELVRGDFENANRSWGMWLPDPNEIRRLAVRDLFNEEIRRTAGENEFTVYRTHLKVELSPGVRHAIEPIWRQQVSTGRSVIAGSLLALLTAVCAVLAGYFRLDDRTAGRYRWPLRFGSVAAVGLATVAAVGMMTFFPIRSLPAPAIPDPVEVPVEAQPAEVYELPQAAFPIETTLESTTHFDCPND